MITKEQIFDLLYSNYDFLNVINLLSFNINGVVFSSTEDEMSNIQIFNNWLKYCRIIYDKCNNIEIRYVKPYKHSDTIDYELYIDDKFIDSYR